MKSAKLALSVVALSCILIGSQVRAAESSTVSHDSITKGAIDCTETNLNPDLQEETPTPAKLIQLALAGVSDLSGILSNDLTPPASTAMPSSVFTQRLEDKVAIGGASDAVPSLSQHVLPNSDSVRSGQSNSGSGAGEPEKSKMGIGMRGCFPIGQHHYRCPWEKLEGAYALTDEQYQKLYDIKGQFIASIVPKGLNVWMLARKMKDLLNVGTVDTNAVRDVEKQIAAATSDISTTAMDSIISANQVLTPEQRKELHKMTIRSTLGGSEHHHEK